MIRDDYDQRNFDFYNWGGPRALQIERAFAKFFKANPRIWQYFNRFSDEIRAAGYKHYGVSAVFERIRWHVNIETREGGGFKLNNNFRAYYARLYHLSHPELKKRFFRNRERKSAGLIKSVGEAALNRRMKKLL